MSTHKHLDKICCAVIAVILIFSVFFLYVGEKQDSETSSCEMGYETKLFDTSSVHTIDIVMDNWEEFLENCADEEYYNCTAVIDGEAYKNIAIRGKGNTSLTQVASYGNNRYSFKIEFDHYDDSNTYYGLDKLCLNNLIQDNTYMKDYLTFQMMADMGVPSSLCSFIYLTVNGEDWGLYLGVEGAEESFLQRNYGTDYGDLYKPDSTGMGGGGTGSADVCLQYINDDADSYSNIFDNAKTDVSQNDETRLMESLKNLNSQENLSGAVDIEEVIRYFAVHNFVLNFDSYTGSMIHNYYLYEKDGQMQMIPWDYNLAFGGFQSGTDAESLINYPIDSPVSGGDVQDRPMISWIFDSEEYTQQYHRIFSEFMEKYFVNGYFQEMFDETVAMISPYVEQDPTKFCTCEEFETGASVLREFCLLRAESVQGQLDGTIGATDTTQDAETFIDAGELQVSDMGSMGETGRNTERTFKEAPGGEDDKMGNPVPGKDDGQQIPGREKIPESEKIQGQEETQGTEWLLLAVSAAVLIFGLVFAVAWKRRRW